MKTVQFKNPVYIGDPVNTIRIFNEKDVDEMIIVDIRAFENGIDFSMLEDIASEAFMPLTYGGGIQTVDEAARILAIGFEKVVVNYQFYVQPDLVQQISNQFGAQSISVGIDAKKNFFGKYHVCGRNGTINMKCSPVEAAKRAEAYGAGEIFLNSIDRDGTMKGYDLSMIKPVVDSVRIPVVVCGGAGNVDDIAEAFRGSHISGAAAGSMFVFYGRKKAVLVNVPTEEEYKRAGLFHEC